VRKPSRILLVSMLSLALLPFAAYAGENDDGATSAKRPEMTREERRAAWEKLSDEEKEVKREQMRARREEMRARWENATPEEREEMRAEIRKRMESMTPEQREAMRKRRAHRGGGKHGGKKDQGT
jgi:hypothetical protein